MTAKRDASPILGYNEANMTLPEHHTTIKYIKYVVFTLFAVLVVLLIFLVHEYSSLRREQVVGARELWVSTVLHEHGPVTASDVTFVRSWMTFDYINRLFQLPASYLQDQLSITDPRYPKMSISSYASHARIDVTPFISELDAAITNYLNASST